MAGQLTDPTTYRQQARAVPAYPENEILVTPNATTSLLSTGMLDREKQAKKQQDTEYEGAGEFRPLLHLLESQHSSDP